MSNSAASTKVTHSPYILGVGEQGKKNLNLQHKILGNNSFEQLKKAGLKKGMTVWDIGCGSGEMTKYIASVVGPSGHVYAMDVNAKQIKVTKERVKSAGFENVSFIAGDILSVENKEFDKADIVYSRLLLMHVKNPIYALRQMISLLKPSGTVSLQEATMDSLKSSSQNTFVQRYHQLLIAYGELNGLDYNIGRKLPALCSELGYFSKIEHYVTRLDLSAVNGKELLLSRVDETKENLIRANLISQAEMDSIRNDMQEYFSNPKSSNEILYTEHTHLLAFL